MGSQMIWAFSTTTEDVALRDSLISKIGQKEALELLATKFPSGSIKKFIEKRRQEVQNNEFGSQNDIISQIEEELIKSIVEK
jgi:intracellular multiplication protein IcmB